MNMYDEFATLVRIFFGRCSRGMAAFLLWCFVIGFLASVVFLFTGAFTLL